MHWVVESFAKPGEDTENKKRKSIGLHSQRSDRDKPPRKPSIMRIVQDCVEVAFKQQKGKEKVGGAEHIHTYTRRWHSFVLWIKSRL